MSVKCQICDLPELAKDEHGREHEPWQGNQDLCCERVFLARRGLTNDFATKRCITKGVAWRAKYLQECADHDDTKRALRVAQAALSRHHAAQTPDEFPNNARIE